MPVRRSTAGALLRLAVQSAVIVQVSCVLRPDVRYGTPSRERDRRPPSASRFDEEQMARFRDELQLFWHAPYRWGGASPEGVDCSGLVHTLFRRALDIPVPRSTRDQFAGGRPVGRDRLQFADLIFFRLGNATGPDHVGLYIARDYFLHASSSQGVTLAHLRDRPFRSRYLGARRYDPEQEREP